MFCSMGAMTTEDNDQQTENKKEILYLNVIWKETGETCYFQIESTTQLKRLMNSYEVSANKAAGTIRFTFNGRIIEPDATPNQLGMRDDDDIYAEESNTNKKWRKKRESASNHKTIKDERAQ